MLGQVILEQLRAGREVCFRNNYSTLGRIAVSINKNGTIHTVDIEKRELRELLFPEELLEKAVLRAEQSDIRQRREVIRG